MADYRIIKTKVKNPMHRRFDAIPFKPCCYCSNFYTPMGLPRHWPKCVLNPDNIRKGKTKK